VAEIVRQDNVITSRIQLLALPEEFAGKFGAQKVAAVSGGAVKDEDGVADDALVVAARIAEGAVVHPQFGQDFTGMETEIPDDIIAGRGGG